MNREDLIREIQERYRQSGRSLEEFAVWNMSKVYRNHAAVAPAEPPAAALEELDQGFVDDEVPRDAAASHVAPTQLANQRASVTPILNPSSDVHEPALPAADLNEFQRRHWAALEAIRLGRGGIAIVSKALRISPNTIKRGIQEIETGNADLYLHAKSRIRKPGGGRKSKKTST